MQDHSQDIQYRFTENEAGGEVTLVSYNPEAIQAIHEFLKFQIREHKTGDPEAVTAPAR
jgi:hypothetical protein